MNGLKFEVVTDNNPLTYVLTSAKLNTTRLRWISQLANFQFSIKYRSGTKHVDADYLSRHPVDELEKLEGESDVILNSGDVNLVLSSVAKQKSNVIRADIGSLEFEIGEQCIGRKKIVTETEMRKAQKEDLVIAPVFEVVEKMYKLGKSEVNDLNKESRILLKQNKKLYVEEGILMRKTKKFNQIVFHDSVF